MRCRGGHSRGGYGRYRRFDGAPGRVVRQRQEALDDAQRRQVDRQPRNDERTGQHRDPDDHQHDEHVAQAGIARLDCLAWSAPTFEWRGDFGVGTLRARRARRHHGRKAQPVVFGPSDGVAEHLVGHIQLLERMNVVRAIAQEFGRLASIGGLNLRVGCRRIQPQDRVQAGVGSYTRTGPRQRAGRRRLRQLHAVVFGQEGVSVATQLVRGDQRRR